MKKIKEILKRIFKRNKERDEPINNAILIANKLEIIANKLIEIILEGKEDVE